MTRLFIVFLPILLFSCNNSDQPKEEVTITKPVVNINATKDQQERRKQSEEYCKAHGVPIYSNPNSLFVDPEDSVTTRTQDEIVDRALALCYIALKGEGLKQKPLEKMDKDFNIISKLTPGEKSFAKALHPTEQEKTNATWRYESLHVMLWALNFIDSLSYPDQMCDVPSDVKFIHDLTYGQFRQKARLRTKKEILDQADLILRLDWACVSARLDKKPAPGNLNSEVVFERHHSLNWLISYMDEDWDDVTTDT